MRRELGIALRARLTWLVATLSAVLVGHGFVLATDLYSGSSRSALASVFQRREMDSLAGIVRPTLGGLDLAISLFAPLVAARVLSVEKERRTFGPLCLLEGSSDRVVLQKLLAAFVAAALPFAAPVTAFIAFRLMGGHLDSIETSLALGGELLHLLLVTAVSVAAAAWTRTLAQAAALGMVISVTSWAIDAAEGFAALAWLGGASAASIEQRLEPFQRGIVSVGSLAWLLIASTGATALALLGGRFDPSRARRSGVAAATVVAVGLLLVTASRTHRGYDWSEQRRASLPPAAVEALRGMPQPLSLDVLLDRDDSRRRQLESDVLSKLHLARPDLTVRMPLDELPTGVAGHHDNDYGRIFIHVGSATLETRSTSRRELVTLIFEAAGLPLPDWTMPTYAGYPLVLDGPRRTALVALAYVGVPLAFLIAGALLTRRRTVR